MKLLVTFHFTMKSNERKTREIEGGTVPLDGT